MRQINQKIIIEKMEEHHLSQNGLAKATGLPKSVISRVLSGKTDNPTLRTILAIAEALETTVDELLW